MDTAPVAASRRHRDVASSPASAPALLPDCAVLYGIGHLLHAALEALRGGKWGFIQLSPDYGRDNSQHGYQAEQEQGQYLQADPPCISGSHNSPRSRKHHI